MPQIMSSSVDLVALSETTWRVCDARFDEGDPRRILGYLSWHEPVYEMMWMRPRPGVVRNYPSIERAVQAIDSTLP
ncbi:hypothetical protein [Agromyces salentinus]|uniref:Uncharacterized protein n=1 Tax=Agromyces salentinus TaxID=269421 RepID=A0ABP4YYQ5_9MICO|nr:hypothetical protein [Agromyces salentinus]